MKVLQVPQSDDCPLGLKYSFQYMAAGGTTLLRFDNYPLSPGREHSPPSHPRDVESIDYTGITDYIDRFYEEMDELHDQQQS